MIAFIVSRAKKLLNTKRPRGVELRSFKGITGDFAFFSALIKNVQRTNPRARDETIRQSVHSKTFPPRFIPRMRKVMLVV
jgi:hypothetical protein